MNASRNRKRLAAVIVGLAPAWIGCGARTELETSSGSSSGSGGSTGTSGAGGSTRLCPAISDPAEPVHLKGTDAQAAVSVASNGCAFASATYTFTGTSYSDAFVAINPVNGAWEATDPVVFAHGETNDGNIGFPALTWDGSEYVAAWIDSSLKVRHISAEGTLQDEPISIFKPKLLSFVDAIDVATDGSIGVLFEDTTVEFVRASAQGDVLVQPVTVAPNCGHYLDDGLAGMSTTNGEHVLVIRYANGTSLGPMSKLMATRFDDQGQVTGSCIPLASGSIDLQQHYGLTQLGGATYFGALVQDKQATGVFVATLTDAGADAVPPLEAPLISAPFVAATSSWLGLWDGQHLELAEHATKPVVEDTPHVADPIAMVGGSDAFLSIWQDTSDLAFRIVTP